MRREGGMLGRGRDRLDGREMVGGDRSSDELDGQRMW